MKIIQKYERIFCLKLSYEGMTTIPFTRKNNLLSLLRGYDIPIKRNFLNATLLGYGKRHKKDEVNKDRKKEERYQKFRDSADENESLKIYFDTFRDEIDNESFWQSSDFLSDLCEFTRFCVASWSKTSTKFFENSETLLTQIPQSSRFKTILTIMDDLADLWHAGEPIPGYEDIKDECKQHISGILYRSQFQTLPQKAVKNLIIDCIVLSTSNPSEFERNWDKYATIVTRRADSDASKYFSEDLLDTVSEDEDESEGEADSDDEDFVVPDDVNPAKRRKLAASDDDEEEDEEMNGSGGLPYWRGVPW